MGITPSKTSLYLPSETLRLCTPDQCWCNSARGHRTSKYIYVERGGDGRERYQDPVDMMAEFMMGGGNGGGGMGMPWKSPAEWTARDFERLGEVLNEYHIRERGRMMGDGGGGGGGGGRGGGFPPGMMPWDDYNGRPGGGGGGGDRRRTHPSWGEFERMQENVEEKFRRMAEEYQRHLAERDAMLFGSNEDRRREQYQKNMLKTLQEIMPQLSQMIAAQQMMGGMGGGGGMMPPVGMPMGGGMPAPMGGVMPGGMGMGMGMPAGGMGGIPGMMGGMMNSMGAPGMAGFAGMGGQGSPMMGGEGMMGGGMSGMGGGLGRRGRGRRARLAQRDDFDDDLGGFGGGRGGQGFGRGPRRWDDGDDMLGGGLGGDGSFPRGPQGGPRPRRSDGDFGGGGHMADPGMFDPLHQVPLRPTQPPSAVQGGFNTSTGFTRPSGPDELPTTVPDRFVSPPAPEMRSPLPPPAWPHRMPPSYPSTWTPAATMPEGPLGYDPTLPPTYTSGPPGGLDSPDIDRAVRFETAASLSRPRAEETRRKEPDAGAVPTGRDL